MIKSAYQFPILKIFSLILITVMTGCFSPSTKSQSATHIEFKNTEINLGTLYQDQPGNATFYFENTGNAPLIIYSAEAGCGCTQPEYPGKPISPGEKGEIKVTFDAKSTGKFIKSITIYHNGDNNFDILKISGTVVAKDNTN